MSTKSKLNPLADLQAIFHRSPLINSDSMLHGILCALLSHPLEIENTHWYTHVEALIDSPSQKEKKALHQYAKNINAYLQSDDYNLRLPEEFDDELFFENHTAEYRQKATHIANWIDGYIYGYAVSQFIQNSTKHKRIEEWIEILQESQRHLHIYIGSLEEEANNNENKKENEEEKYDLIEITEFLRIGAYSTQNILHQIYYEEINQPLN